MEIRMRTFWATVLELCVHNDCIIPFYLYVFENQSS
jgi:hypothetical protein